MTTNTDSPSNSLLALLQLASPALPVGAYSYSEGLENLIATGVISQAGGLRHWLEQELRYGAARLEAAVVVRIHTHHHDPAQVQYWNNWLTATRETAELREQSWQMGNSLMLLLQQLTPLPCDYGVTDWNYPVAFALAAAHWQIPLGQTVCAYLHSWAANLVSAGIKLIPLGQTQGQKLLWQLRELIQQVSDRTCQLPDAELYTSGWGLALASMAHAHQYTRLFRS